MSDVSVVLEKCGTCLEGPHWDNENDCLYVVDFYDESVHRWSEKNQKHDKIELGVNVSSIVPTKTPSILAVTANHRFLLLDWESGAMTTMAEIDQDRPENNFNDGKCDARGRYWAGTYGLLETETKMKKSKQGSLFCLDEKRSVTKQLDGLDLSNGLCWTADNKTMYFIDTMTRQVDALDYCLETGKINSRRSVIKVPKEEGFPDGMTIDTDGNVWVACYDGSKVNRYNPHTGEKLQTINLPCSCITSCCFGGRDLDTLYVTSSRYGLSKEELEEQPLAGSLFKVTGLGVKGQPAHQYAG